MRWDILLLGGIKMVPVIGSSVLGLGAVALFLATLRINGRKRYRDGRSTCRKYTGFSTLPPGVGGPTLPGASDGRGTTPNAGRQRSDFPPARWRSAACRRTGRCDAGPLRAFQSR